MNILMGCLLLVATTAVHAAAMVVLIHWMRVTGVKQWFRRSLVTKCGVVAVVAIVMFVASIVEAALWAVTYIAVGAIAGFEDALYFSMVTYTTLGYGDITMDGHWRLLSAFQAANGIIMFGWTTAIIVWAVQRAHGPQPESPQEQTHDV